MAEQKATNVHWHEGDITREHRAKLLGHKGATLWFTGLSGSGKSTVAVELEGMLNERGVLAYRLDGDNVRMGINKNLGFSAEDRTENIRRIGEVAKLFVDAGAIVLTAFISPFRAERRLARSLLAEGEFLEIFVDVPLTVAESRDAKGLYAKARRGELKNFTGIDSPYEPPEKPEIYIDTTRTGSEESASEIVDELRKAGMLGPAG
jgi:adenylylsulfate kinase